LLQRSKVANPADEILAAKLLDQRLIAAADEPDRA